MNFKVNYFDINSFFLLSAAVVVRKFFIKLDNATLNFSYFFFLIPNFGSALLESNDDLTADLVSFEVYYLITFSSIVFFLGVAGLIQATKKNNLILFLINLEIIFLGAGLLFIFFSVYRFYDPIGQVYALFTLVLAAVDSAIGLALFLLLKRVEVETNLSNKSNIKFYISEKDLFSPTKSSKNFDDTDI